jgi:DNA-binding beta-propeller fold protein YncE
MTVNTIHVDPAFGHILVANRTSGSLSIFNEFDGRLIEEFELEVLGEPTYLFSLASTHEVAIADRLNNQIVFVDSTTYEVTGTVPTGAGNFHLWGNPKQTQLWVVNDIDDSLTVIDPRSKTEITRVALTAEMIGLNAKPHDVILDSNGKYAYVTIQVEGEDPDLLLKIDTRSFEVVDSAEVGKDSHVSLAPENGLLYVLAQESDRIDIFDRRGSGLTQVGTIDQPGAHGVVASPDGRYLYTTNLPGGGPNGIFVIDTVTNEIVGDPDGVDAPAFPGSFPHNLTISNDGDRLFLAHSGASANAVTFFSLEDPTLPVFENTTNGQGLNPFGLTYVASLEDELIVKGENNDVVKARSGNDTVYGGQGDDDLAGQAGNDKLFGEVGHDLLSGNNGDDVLIGGRGRDTLWGGDGNDLLIGVEVESLTPGQGEIDTFRGASGADTFELGNALSAYYDDGDENSIGTGDQAVIKDFSLAENDVIRLHGSADLYELSVAGGTTSIFYNPLGQDAELIGVVQNVRRLELTSDAFEYAKV